MNRLNTLCTHLLSHASRMLLSLRYRFIFRNPHTLTQIDKSKGTLFLPNHTSHIDPLFFMSYFWPKYKTHPLVVDTISRLPFMSSFLPLVGAISIPDFETSINQYKIKKGEKSLSVLAEKLNQKKHFVIFPSGKFKNQGEEHLGGSFAVHNLLHKAPDTQIVLVRISGLWGSSFSKALTGKSPNLFHKLKEGALTLVKNGFFFTPRRKVFVDFVVNPPDFPRNQDKLAINSYLEKWYNRYPTREGKTAAEEPLQLVPYYFWSKKLPVVLSKQENISMDSAKSKEIAQEITKELQKILNNPNLEISPEQYLGRDLGLDSLHLAEIASFLAKRYTAAPIDFTELQKVKDLIIYAQKKEKTIKKTSNLTWKTDAKRLDPGLLKGKTFQEAFLHICDKMKSSSFIADDISGVFSYKKAKKTVLILAQAFAQIPEKQVAILLPSSVGSTLIILALHFAGKIPVMLNWTLGPRYLEAMMEIAQAKTVISSWHFFEKINFVDFGNLIDNIGLIEDIKKKLTFTEKLSGIFQSFLSSKRLLQKLQLDHISEEDPAVILFTSGTEAYPKGVPLTHKNLLSNCHSIFHSFRNFFNKEDTIYCILPQFHSFGFTVSTFSPIFAGLKTAFYPNPTEYLEIIEGIDRWQGTVMPIVPIFLQNLLDTAEPDEIKRLRLAITAGEKTPSELFERVQKRKNPFYLLEGYGLTETAPTVSVNRIEYPHTGVGKLLPDVEIKTIHPETKQPLPEGEVGEICIYGPNIFSGYLNENASPFIEIEKKKWFLTGDIGFVDRKNFLHVTGRLKRCIKLGGEMVSMHAIEEALREACKKKNLVKDDATSVALCETQQQLILFTTFELPLDLVHQLLQESGFSNLLKISQVKQIEEIPLMGTGKIDYKKLHSNYL